MARAFSTAREKYSGRGADGALDVDGRHQARQFFLRRQHAFGRPHHDEAGKHQRRHHKGAPKHSRDGHGLSLPPMIYCAQAHDACPNANVA